AVTLPVTNCQSSLTHCLNCSCGEAIVPEKTGEARDRRERNCFQASRCERRKDVDVSSEQYAHDSHRPSHRIRWRSRQLRTPWRFKARGTRRGSDTFGPQLTASLGDLWGLPSESAVAALLGNCLIDVNSLSAPAWSWRATNLSRALRVAHG